MLGERSKHLRRLIIQALEGGGRGHVGPSFSLVEILRVLYDDIVKHDPKRPDWPDRDRVILSKGHGCLALYAILADHGYFPLSELSNFCRRGAMLGGHPEHHIPGVEVSTGSLGHGLALGVGMALAGKRTFVIVGDGECDEGSIWEAALVAGKYKLSNLTVIVDYNHRQSYGTIEEVQPLEPFRNKWHSFGFMATEIDGHDIQALNGMLIQENRPMAFLCHTVKGKGVQSIENDPLWHHRDVFTAEDANRLRAELA